MELNLLWSLVSSVLFIMRSTPSKCSPAVSSVFTMFAPLLPKNTLSASTLEPIFSSTFGVAAPSLFFSVALLPPTKIPPPMMTGFAGSVPATRSDTCSALGRNRLRASADFRPPVAVVVTPASASTSEGL